MKGCAVRGLISFGALLGFIAAVGAGLHYQYGLATSGVAGVAIFAGFCGWVAMNLLLATVKAWRERRALLAGLAGDPPVDGRHAILVGHIQPTGRALRAPLSGRECIAYTFEVYELRSSHGTKGVSKVVYCDGTALTPSAIVTRDGSYRLLAGPELDCAPAEFDRAAAISRITDFTRTLPFEASPAPVTRPAIEQQWNDDDGEYRRERRLIEGDVNLTNFRVTERHIEANARVCVFGVYSASKRAIVPDKNDWSKTTRLMKGDPDSIVRQLRSSMVRRTIGALVSLAVATAALAAFIAHLS